MNGTAAAERSAGANDGPPIGGAGMARLCALLGCRVPIVQGGMTLVGHGRLAGAVSATGGVGLVSAGRLSAEEFAREILLARAVAGRTIGVNIPVTRDTDWMVRMVAVAAEAGVRAVVLGGGNPAPWMEALRAAGKVVGVLVASVEQARKAEVLGADLVIAEGVESGGKNGLDEVGILTLLPAVAAAVSVPVVAAGGIVDGRSAAAAFCLGADGVQMGTRFMLSEESPIHPRTKALLVGSDARETVVIGRRFGMNRRVYRNSAAEKVLRRESAATQEEMIAMLSGHLSHKGLVEGDTENGLIPCGQGVGRISSVLPVREIVSEVCRDVRVVQARASEAARLLDGAESGARAR